MPSIFSQSRFIFPYEYKFPGQGSDERILYATRENKLTLWVKRLFIIVVALALFLAGWLLARFLTAAFNLHLSAIIVLAVFATSLTFFVIGWWWTNTLWQKSIAIVTTKRLIKFIYTTPASRHSLALPLEMIVDTGAYTKGFLQSFLRLGTFTARSSASSSGVATEDTARVNKKYFYIENIKHAEDLQHYVSKLLSVFKDRQSEMTTFRPFIPHLKGEARSRFIQENYPHFWS